MIDDVPVENLIKGPSLFHRAGFRSAEGVVGEGDGVVGQRAVNGVELPGTQGGAIQRVVGVTRDARAVRHLGKTTINRVVGKGDVGRGVLGIGNITPA